MRAFVWIGMVVVAAGGLTPAGAQQSNSPLYPPGAMVAPPSWPAWQGVQDGRGGLAPPYFPAPRFPTDSRNLTLDNRAPTLWPAAPDLRDRTPQFGPPLDNGALGTGTRRSDGFRSPAAPEPGRPSWR
jgi:hypothetical protein